MKSNKLTNLVGNVMTFADKYQREIMLGGAIAGTIVTAVLSWNAGIKADKIISSQKAKMEANEEEMRKEGASSDAIKEMKKEVTIETVKKMVPVVAPPALAASGTIVSVVGGYKVASKQIAVLSSLYNVAEKRLGDFTEKTKEVVGEKKAQEIEDKVREKKIKEYPTPEAAKIVDTGKGTLLCFDDYSSKYFYSSPESIKRAFNTINNRLNNYSYASLNEYYDEVGLPHAPLGDDLGFSIDDGLVDIDHVFSTFLNEDDVPVLVVKYSVSPKYGEHRGGMYNYI